MFNPNFVKLEDNSVEEIPCGIIVENNNFSAINLETFNTLLE